ncbi:SusC/RagA family TonB-linked outer membrane protein [Chryseolinea sp. T2]|uniref:SusC/RagA family TonB-linked outer membrane protein n=1 Tax=Chryseolinea sp. T2 TaxID=3129255 RepID=UPI003077A49B
MKRLYERLTRTSLVFVFLVMFSSAFAQERIVTGTVIDADNLAVPGVNIVKKGTTTGTTSDSEGKFSISAGENDVLIFSFIGSETQEITVGTRTTIDVSMVADATQLGEVVVTALGIERDEKSLGYAVSKVKGAEFTKVARENFLTSMQGKVAGVTINETGGAGSTVSVIIRGAKSLSNDNQPLYVVDGVPLFNSANNVSGFGSGNNTVDYGNAISDIDPESIESVSVLKGASATALYGSRASNGVILITTKKAKAGSGLKVSLSTNNSFDLPQRYLGVQHKYGGYIITTPEQNGSTVFPALISPFGVGAELNKGYWAAQWNSPLDANGQPIPTELKSYPNNVKNFLNDYAVTSTNSAQVSSGGKYLNLRLGLTNMTNKGLIPNSDINRNNLSLSASAKATEKFTVSTDINYANSWSKNRPSGDRGTNPLQWAYYTPVYVNIMDLKDYDIGQGNTIKNVVPGDSDNPWMLANDVNNGFNRNQLYGNVMATYEFTPKISLMGRMMIDKVDEVRESKIGLGYSQEPHNGAYGISNSNSFERNTDALLSYRDTFGDFSVNVSVGGNVRYSKSSNVSNSSKPGSGLIIPNLYTLSNIANTSLNYSSASYEKGVNSVYGTANLAWKESIYLDLTGRNDWSSTLPASSRSFFYPSASLSVLINEFVNINHVDLLKVRAGVARTGYDTNPYNLLQVYTNAGQWGEALMLAKQSGLLNPNLLPEQITSQEYGVEARLFNNRIRFDGTVYNMDDKNQIFQVPIAQSSGFGSVNINAGLLQSRGVEIVIGGTPIQTNNWTWDLNLNFTKNETKVLELAENIDYVQPWSQANVANRGYVKGATLPDGTIADGLTGNLYTRKTLRVTDKESPYYNYPIIPGNPLTGSFDDDPELTNSNIYSKVGNYNPKFIMGLQTTLTWKNFSLSATFDWRHGGQFVSQTSRYLNDDMLTEWWASKVVTPGVSGGEASQELRDWVVANANTLIYPERVYPIGGPTPETGGFPESDVMAFPGNKDGVFFPGVFGETDEDGHFTLYQENLGNPGTIFEPWGSSNPWAVGTYAVYDADYIKLREISLSYNIPTALTKKLKMENAYIGVYSRNIMLWTASGFGVDPERAFQPSGNGLYQGVERYNVSPWMVPVGFKLGVTF